MKLLKDGSEWSKRVLCRLGFHDWFPNHGGTRVCLRRGCAAIDMYFGITGALRRLREQYTGEQLEKLAGVEFPLYRSLIKFMSIFIVGSIIAIGVWKFIEQVHGDIENPAGAVIRLGMAAVFSIIVWRIIQRKTGAKQ